MAQESGSGDRPESPERGEAAAQDESVHHGSGIGEHGGQGPSKVDAMGEDKRRQVVGHSYGPTAANQVKFFAIVGAVAVAIIGGWTVAVAAFDRPPDEYPDEAPWSASDAQQVPTRSPSGPCGEPGNAYPPPADSPCATGPSSTDEPPLRGAEGSPEQQASGEAGGSGNSEPSQD